VNRLIAALGVLAVAVACLAGWSWWRSDARRIGRALDRLERACEKSGPDGALDLVSRTATIVDAFAPGMLVTARPYEGSIRDPRELAGVIHRYRAGAERVRISESERELAVGERDTAEMSVVFVVEGDRGGRPGRERFRARLFWVEIEGDWKIREVEVVEVLDPGGLF
jgi:hypothetical protein